MALSGTGTGSFLRLVGTEQFGRQLVESRLDAGKRAALQRDALEVDLDEAAHEHAHSFGRRAAAARGESHLHQSSRTAADHQPRLLELERWQAGHEHVLDSCRETLTRLEQVHASLMGELANYVEDNHENLMEGDFSLSDFVDRFGPRWAHLNTMLAVLRPLAAAKNKTEAN